MQNKKVKRGVTLVFKGDNSNKHLDIHFTVGGRYRVYDMKDAYPDKYKERTGVLIVWCDDIDIHLVEYLNMEEWEIV